MQVLATITGSSRYNPLIRLSGGSGRPYTFGWNEEFKTHVWDRGIISHQDSTDLDDIFTTKDPFYRPSVRILKEEPKEIEPIKEATPISVATKRRKRVAI